MECHTFNNFLDDSSQLLGFGHIYESDSPPSHWITNAKETKLRYTPREYDAQLRQHPNRVLATNQYFEDDTESGSGSSECAPSLYSKTTQESDLYGLDEDPGLSEISYPQSTLFEKDNINLSSCHQLTKHPDPSLYWTKEPESGPEPETLSNSSLSKNCGNYSTFSDTEDVTDEYVASLYERENAIADSPESDSGSTHTMSYYLYGSPIIRNPSPWYTTDSLAVPKETDILPNYESELGDRSTQAESIYTTDTDSSPGYSPFAKAPIQTSTTYLKTPHNIDSVNPRSKPRMKRRVKYCPVCNKALMRDLTRHIRTHSKESGIWCPFPRELCNHKRGIFNRRYEFKKHLITSHFECDDKQAARETTWLNVKLQLSGKCQCGERFSNVKHWISNHIENCRCPLLANSSEDFDHRSKNTLYTM